MVGSRASYGYGRGGNVNSGMVCTPFERCSGAVRRVVVNLNPTNQFTRPWWILEWRFAAVLLFLRRRGEQEAVVLRCDRADRPQEGVSGRGLGRQQQPVRLQRDVAGGQNGASGPPAQTIRIEMGGPTRDV